MTHEDNPRVFMDISIGGQYAGRMEFELRADTVPKTAENFRLVQCVLLGLHTLCYNGFQASKQKFSNFCMVRVFMEPKKIFNFFYD